MSLFSYKLMAALVILTITLLASWKPLGARFNAKEKMQFRLGESFASGVFLGVAIFHMLPDASVTFRQVFPQADFFIVILLCVLGFVGLLLIEKNLATHKTLLYTQKENIIPLALLLILSVHAFITGTALGINNSFSAAGIIFLAIIAHKGSESFSLATALYRSNWESTQVMLFFFCFALVTPLGILSGSLITALIKSQTNLVTQACFNAIAAGTFFYIATIHNPIIKNNYKNVSVSEFFYFLLGLISMAIVGWWV